MRKPPKDYYRIKSISRVKKILSCRNEILVRTMYDNEEDVTPSGIIKVGDTDWEPAAHANRISEVVMLPNTLYYGLKWHKKFPNATESMPWRTDIQIQVGDIVWHDYMNSLNCPILDVDDEPGVQYKLLNYYDLYVVKRKEESAVSIVLNPGETFYYNGETYIIENEGMNKIIPLNGYVLCEEVLEEQKGDMDVLEKHIDKRYGRVAFVGKPNYGYRCERIKQPPIEKDKDGDMGLVPGDVIVKKNPQIHIMLEDALHARFNGDTLYFIIQRKDIYAKKI